MVKPFSFEMPLNEWRHYLQDINFWLNGYLDSDAYRSLEENFDFYREWYVRWNVGVGPTCCFTRAVSSIVRDVTIRRHGPFDHVIDVDMKEAAVLPAGTSLSISDKLTIKVADQLGLKVEGDERWYYTYGLKGGYSPAYVRRSIVPRINQNLVGKKYLLVIENLDETIKPIKIDAFTEDLLCIPPPTWKKSFWLVSATSRDVYERSKADDDRRPIKPSSGDDIVILTLYSLHQAAKYISGVTGCKDERYWHHVAVRCFHCATILLIPHCSSAHGDGDQQRSGAPGDITSDELIRHWAAQDLITGVLERTGEVTEADFQDKCNDVYKVGNIILEAFQEYSLLQLPFSPATKADEATKSAAHFLAYHNLIAECHTIEELFEGNHPGLEHMQWISHAGDQGWHVSRDWLSHGTSGPSSLIVRHCLQQSRLFAHLDHLLAKLPCLRVLDLSYTQIQLLPSSVSRLQQLQLLYLSYTPLESLPYSICLLQKLQLLSLRGCYNLASPFNFSNTKVIIPENNISGKSYLLYLDLSYSNIKTFQCDFFRHLPNLQKLLFVKCSNLDNLPPSIAALSCLTTLELTGTQVKSFPREMFEEMKKLQSLKLTENKKLLFVPGLVSKLHGLINIHIEGRESMTEVEVTLEKHPTLRSFTFIGVPHMRQLSLRGCKMLEHVDIKEVDSLEELDLSATAIKELPEDIPNLPQLRRLLLMGVPFLRRFPWHKLQRLPDVFCLDQCSDGTANHSIPQADVHVCISDSRLFYSINYDTMELVTSGRLLKSFYIQVTSGKVATRKIHDEEDMVQTNKFQVAQTTYADVNRHYLTDDGVSMVSMNDVPPFQKTDRHVEFLAMDRYPDGLYYLLSVTKSISMSDDTHVSCLSDLGGWDELEECKLQRCHKMKTVFRYGVETLSYVCASHLKSLTHFYTGGSGFHALKHLLPEIGGCNATSICTAKSCDFGHPLLLQP